MRVLIAALAVLLIAVLACGDDEAGGVVNLTLVNATNEEVIVYITGSQYRLGPQSEDAITLSERDEYPVLASGVETGDTLFRGNLTPDDIAAMDNRLVITKGGE